LAWRIEYSDTAVAQLRKLDKRTARRLLDYGEELAGREAPRQQGEALSGRLGELWKFPAGDKLLICDLQDRVDRIIVLRLGNN